MAQNASCVYGICSSGLLTEQESQLLELTRLNSNRLTEVENYTKGLGLDWSFELDGCDSRARNVVIGLAQELGISAGTVRLQAPRSIKSRFIPWSPEISWRHHTAAFIKVENQFYVIDYALFQTPVELGEWLEALTIDGVNVDIEYSNRFFTNPLESSQSTWSEMDYEGFLTTKNYSPKLNQDSSQLIKIIESEFFEALKTHSFFKQHISDRYTFWGDTFTLKLDNSLKQQLMLATHCQNSQSGQVSECTSYVQAMGQTCFFKWEMAEKPRLHEEMLCF